MAGAEAFLQRGKDENCLPRRRFRLPGVHSPPISRQANHQTQQSRHQTGEETPRHGNARLRGGNAAMVLARSTRSREEGELLPGSGVIQGLCQPGPLHVAAHLQMGLPPPLPQAEDMDHQPLLGRYNKSRQDRWVFGDRDSGAYMPKLAWTKIVRHPLVRGRASPDDLAQASSGRTAPQKQATARPQHPPPAPQAKRPLPAMRRPASARRPRTTKPATMGTVAPRHPQGDHQAHRHTRAGRPTGRHPSHARTLPPPGNRRTQGTSTSLYLKPPTGLAERVRDEGSRSRGGGQQGLGAWYGVMLILCANCAVPGLGPRLLSHRLLRRS